MIRSYMFFSFTYRCNTLEKNGTTLRLDKGIFFFFLDKNGKRNVNDDNRKLVIERNNKKNTIFSVDLARKISWNDERTF